MYDGQRHTSYRLSLPVTRVGASIVSRKWWPGKCSPFNPRIKMHGGTGSIRHASHVGQRLGQGWPLADTGEPPALLPDGRFLR